MLWYQKKKKKRIFLFLLTSSRFLQRPFKRSPSVGHAAQLNSTKRKVIIGRMSKSRGNLEWYPLIYFWQAAFKTKIMQRKNKKKLREYL